MQFSMEGPLPRQPVAAGPSPFPSLPFLTDAYLAGPQSAAAAHQQLVFQQGSLLDHTAAVAAAADRLSNAGAERWGDPSGAAALHLLGAPRDGDGNDLLSSVQDPSAYSASYFGSYLCAPSGFSLDNPQGPSGGAPRPFSPSHLAATPESGNISCLGYTPSNGFPLYYGASFPLPPPHPLASGGSQEGPMIAANAGPAVAQKNAAQDAQGFASDYDRLTRELGKYCASLRDLVTDNPSFADELNSTLETAIHSAGEVTRVQRKLLLSVSQQKHLVEDSRLIHSKVHMLHRILQKTAPQYGQWLEEHAVLRDHMQQLEQQYRDPVGYKDLVGKENIPGNVRNCTSSRRRRSSSSSSSRSTRQYKRQRIVLQGQYSEGLLLPAIKSEPTASSCS